jgi:hypothetical protein
MQKIDNKKELKHLYRASARKAEIHEIYLSDIRRAAPRNGAPSSASHFPSRRIEIGLTQWKIDVK